MIVEDEVRKTLGDQLIQIIALRCELARLQEENVALKPKEKPKK